MGQAKQRGTFEQRLAAAQERDAAARMERKRIAAERDAEWRRLNEEAMERRAAAEEAIRQVRIADGLDPDLPKQSDYSAFGRRRVVSIGAARMASMAALALVAHARSVPTLREIAQMQREADIKRIHDQQRLEALVSAHDAAYKKGIYGRPS